MVKTVYADVLFIINFMINYLILFATGRISASVICRLKIFISALLGGIYGIAVFLPELSSLSSAGIKILVSAVMVALAFGFCNIFKNILLFLAVSFSFGGVCFALALFSPGRFLEIKNGIYYIHISLDILLLSCLTAYILLSLVFRRSAARSDRKISRARIISNGKELNLSTLHDTGNSLRDTATNAPVLISDYHTLRTLLPDGAKKILDKTPPDSFYLALDRISQFGQFKLIPYKTVGLDFSLLLAYRPEKVILNSKALPNALIAISSSRVSDGGAYSAII